MKNKKRLVLAGAAAAALVATLAFAQTGVLFVANDNVGINQPDPQAPLHITGATSAPFWLENSGQARTWAFTNGTGGNFAVNLVGSGGNEVTVRRRGDFGGNATMKVDGSVEADNVTFTSSRELKTDFETVDTRQVLDKVAGLEISTWRLKRSEPGARNMGPVAEDFHEAFGLGDGQHLSVVDSNGVALAAIQGLHAELAERDAQIAELQQRLAELESRIGS